MRKASLASVVAALTGLAALAATGCGGRAEAGAGPAIDPPYPPGSLPALRDGTPRSPRIASYRLDATLDPATRQITATSTLTWKHTGNQPITSLPFHLYMNAFKNEESVFMKESKGRHRGQVAGKDAWGFIDVSSLKVGGVELRPAARYGEDETTLEVPLPAPVEPGAEVTVDFAFTVQLPEVFARTGYKGDFIMVGQWFPKIGVLATDDQGGQRWHCDTFHLNSEFFADFGTYDVTLDVPETHAVAATGVLVKREGSKRTWRAEDVHDFAWMADPRMIVAETTAMADSPHPVKVLVYHRPEQAPWAQRHLVAARRTIETYSRLFYEYPWSVMTIIDPPPEADGSAGGMEYPTIVTTAGDRALTASPGVRMPEFVTIHEVGHNWFQGILATNEVDEAWLDEGMNEYTNGIVLEEWFGVKASMIDWAGLELGHYELRRLAGDPTDDAVPTATKSYEFPSNGDYSEQSYGKTAISMKTLEHMMGRDKFFAALGAYAKAWAFRHPRKDDLFAALGEALGQDVDWFLRPAFEGTGSVKLKVESVKSRRKHTPRGVFGDGDARKKVGEKDAPDGDTWVHDILVSNTGGVPVMTDLRVVYTDGSEQRLRWDDRKTWARFTVESKSQVALVELDPDHLVLLERDRLDNALRMRPDSSGSWRAASRVGFWAQTVLQLVGI